MTAPATIATPRLDLISMPPAFLEATVAGDLDTASRLIGLRVPGEWLDERDLAAWRLNDLRKDPGAQPWLLRAIGLRATGEMIGHIGFHTPPGPTYLDATAPGGIESGYTIFTPYRRHGYAREALAALIDWAAHEHGIARFVLSISPDNAPSLGIARHFGFVKVGSHIDDEDGPEDVFLLERNPES